MISLFLLVQPPSKKTTRCATVLPWIDQTNRQLNATVETPEPTTPNLHRDGTQGPHGRDPQQDPRRK